MEENVNQAYEKYALNKSVISLYYEAVASGICEDYLPMQLFKQKYPQEYKRFNAVHRRRATIHESINAMKIVSDKIYFGTLTYNNDKNVNKEVVKRKEAFNFLNAQFEYFLVVEEHGEDNGRYHVHFLGLFNKDHDFDSFVRDWHSRQNLRLLNDKENVAQYLCKYLSKDLPRVRRNKALVSLARSYHAAKSLQRFFPNVEEFSPRVRVGGVAFINAIDMLE